MRDAFEQWSIGGDAGRVARVHAGNVYGRYGIANLFFTFPEARPM